MFVGGDLYERKLAYTKGLRFLFFCDIIFLERRKRI